MAIFAINCRKEPRKRGDSHPFVLYNGSEPAGDRLYKGNSQDCPWPLKSDPEAFLSFKDDNFSAGWTRYKTQEAGDEAAKKLQAYLEKKDADHYNSKTKKKNQEELF